MSEIVNSGPPVVVIYARAARSERGALQAQVRRLRQLARGHGWVDPGVVAEAGIGRISEAAVETLRAADVVVVQGLDRLARDTLGALDILDVLEGAGTRVMTVVGGSLRDHTAGADSRRVRELLQLIREVEGAAHSERIRRGIAAAKARREVQR